MAIVSSGNRNEHFLQKTKQMTSTMRCRIELVMEATHFLLIL
jgi:hypothetical protein